MKTIDFFSHCIPRNQSSHPPKCFDLECQLVGIQVFFSTKYVSLIKKGDPTFFPIQTENFVYFEIDRSNSTRSDLFRRWLEYKGLISLIFK